MRKDLRLGLGIGALATVFAVTFLVVRHHTHNQAQLAQTEGSDEVPEAEGGAPEANVPATAPNGVTPGGGGGAVVLPPLQPVKPQFDPPPAPPKLIGEQKGGAGPKAGGAQPKAGAQPKTAREPAAEIDEPFARRGTRSIEPPMPGPAGKPARAGDDPSDWDALLNYGGPVTGSAVTRNPIPARQVAPPGTALPNPRRSVSARTDPGGGLVSAATGRPYTVREGDTFVSVAKAVYGNSKYYLQIERANPQVNPSRLRPGQQIVLPELSPEARSAARQPSGPFDRDEDNRPVNPRTEYRVDAGDSLYRISAKVYGTPRMVDALYDANRAVIGPDPERLRFGMILRLPRATEHADVK